MSTAAGPVLSVKALNRALIHRQVLAERSTMSPAGAVAHLAGLQAQAPNPPYIGLWTRSGTPSPPTSSTAERGAVSARGRLAQP